MTFMSCSIKEDRQRQVLAHLAHERGQPGGLCGFMPAVGSSRSSSFGFEASARAISTRRWSAVGQVDREVVEVARPGRRRRACRRPTCGPGALHAGPTAAARCAEQARLHPAWRRPSRSRAPSSCRTAGCSETCGRCRAGDLVRARPGDVTTVEDDPTARRTRKAGQHVEERRLAGAVGTDDRDDRRGRDVERHVVHGDETAELLRDPVRPRIGLARYGAVAPWAAATVGTHPGRVDAHRPIVSMSPGSSISISPIPRLSSSLRRAQGSGPAATAPSRARA